MSELFAKLTPEEFIALVAIVGGLLFLTSCVAAEYWSKVRKTDAALKLKTDMLDRGMSAEEIRTVLDAGNTPRTSSWK
jgi:hypothetical protein